MSRIGKIPVEILDGVEVKVNDNVVTVKGPKGELKQVITDKIDVETTDSEVIVTRRDDSKESKSLHGLTRSLIFNMVEGVTSGFSKELEINGVGYRAKKQGNTLNLSLGYSNPIDLEIPKGIEVEVEKETKLKVSGIDKQKVGQFAAIIREQRKPEVYNGKGVKYKDEHIRRKEGKAAQ